MDHVKQRFQKGAEMFRMIRTTARRVAHAMGRAARSYCDHMVVMDPSGHAMYPWF